MHEAFHRRINGQLEVLIRTQSQVQNSFAVVFLKVVLKDFFTVVFKGLGENTNGLLVSTSCTWTLSEELWPKQSFVQPVSRRGDCEDFSLCFLKFRVVRTAVDDYKIFWVSICQVTAGHLHPEVLTLSGMRPSLYPHKVSWTSGFSKNISVAVLNSICPQQSVPNLLCISHMLTCVKRFRSFDPVCWSSTEHCGKGIYLSSPSSRGKLLC